MKKGVSQSTNNRFKDWAPVMADRDTPKEQAKSKSDKLLKEHLPDSAIWEDDLVSRALRSEKKAWIIAIVAIVLLFMSIATTLFLMPLKTESPFVVKVNEGTGVVQVLDGIGSHKGKPVTYDDAVHRFFILKYIRHRETFSIAQEELNYQVLGVMSSPNESARYYREINEKGSQYRNFRAGDQKLVKIKTVTPLNDDGSVFSVRFSTWVENGSSVSKKQDWIVTVETDYLKPPKDVQERQINPLGFQVKSYRKDPEVI